MFQTDVNKHYCLKLIATRLFATILLRYNTVAPKRQPQVRLQLASSIQGIPKKHFDQYLELSKAHPN
jgi:hypothetical protein